jgi:ankyrin repeat protein
MLLEKDDIKVNAIMEDGTTPLHIACNYNNIEVVKLLLQQQIDVNLKNTDGDTPLSIAIRQNHTEVIKLLVDAGATDLR